jgi:hypothetical protein
LETAVTSLGLKGYKIIAPALKGRSTIRCCIQCGRLQRSTAYPVLIHFGILGAAGGLADHVNINPMSLHDVARAYPDIPFIIPPFRMRVSAGAAAAGMVCPNIYVAHRKQSVDTVDALSIDSEGSVQEILRDPSAAAYSVRTDSEWFPRGFVKPYMMNSEGYVSNWEWIRKRSG